MESDRILGAAARAKGAISAQETSQDASQLQEKWSVTIVGMLPTPAATREVIPD